MAEIIPRAAKARASGAANGIVWLPHEGGQYFGAAAFASNRGDFERAAAFAGTVARVCICGQNEDLADVCGPTISLAKEIYRRARCEDQERQAATWL